MPAGVLGEEALEPGLTANLAMSLMKYRTAARIAPTWMMAVKAVSAGSSIVYPSSFSTTVRWPVLEIGRNSESPSTMPRMMACHQFMVSSFSARGEPESGYRVSMWSSGTRSRRSQRYLTSVMVPPGTGVVRVMPSCTAPARA